MQENFRDAERHARLALAIDPRDDEAFVIMATARAHKFPAARPFLKFNLFGAKMGRNKFTIALYFGIMILWMCIMILVLSLDDWSGWILEIVSLGFLGFGILGLVSSWRSKRRSK